MSDKALQIRRNNGLELGKVPPQATDLERGLIGNMILFSWVVPLTLTVLNSDDFYNDTNKQIFEAIKQMFDKSESIDIMTLANKLKTMGVLEDIGGAYVIVELTNTAIFPNESKINQWCGIIKQKSTQRSLIRIAGELANKAYSEEEDVFDLLNTTTQDILILNEGGSRKKVEHISVITNEVFWNITKIRSGEISDDTIITHIPSINLLTGGLAKSDLIILAARPGMGKTALMISIVVHLALQGIPVVIFSLEMSEEQLVKRILSILAEIPHHVLRKPTHMTDEDYEKFVNATNKLQELPIYIDDTPAINITELRSKVHILKHNHNIQAVFVDYIQLMSGSGKGRENRESEISGISRGLKSVAKINDMPVMALSQLNRDVEKRPSKKPQLSDLRESGAIEQDADLVLLLFRPSYYNFEAYENFNPEEIERLGELIVAKNRHGETGGCYLEFIAARMYYKDFLLNN